MKNVRRWHLYLSCFFAPLLLFYICTGWYQTLTENRNKSLGEQDTLVAKLTSVHVDQVYPSRSAKSYSPRLFRAFVVVMSISLITTIGLGIFLAFKTTRKSWTIWLVLSLGLALPVLFLWLGQKKG